MAPQLASDGLGYYCPLHQLLLTSEHKCCHLYRCRAWEAWTAGEWHLIMFNDESCFPITFYERCVWVWQCNGQMVHTSCPFCGETNRRKPEIMYTGTVFEQDNACPRIAHVSRACWGLLLVRKIPRPLHHWASLQRHWRGLHLSTYVQYLEEQLQELRTNFLKGGSNGSLTTFQTELQPEEVWHTLSWFQWSCLFNSLL